MSCVPESPRWLLIKAKPFAPGSACLRSDSVCGLGGGVLGGRHQGRLSNPSPCPRVESVKFSYHGCRFLGAIYFVVPWQILHSVWV